MQAANQELFDGHIGHQADLARYSNGVVRRIIATLNRSDARLAAELQRAIDGMGSSFKIERLESMLATLREVNAQAFAQIDKELASELRDFVAEESAWQSMVIKEAVPAVVSVATVSAEQAYAAAMARPFQGVILKGALKDLSDQRAKMVRQTIAQGFVEGRTTDQIIRDIMGTRSKGYADGLMGKSRRDVEAITRTALSHTAGVAQQQVIDANADLIKAVMWSATLDIRTSPVCRPRDGKTYTATAPHKPIGHSLPWLGGPGAAHWRCRSARVPVLKSWREMGIPFDDMSEGTRASMDGQVPEATSYGDWLKKQSAARQDDVLGPTRGKLLREGGLTVDDMYSQKGQYLTLDQLKERNASAFKKAGL